MIDISASFELKTIKGFFFCYDILLSNIWCDTRFLTIIDPVFYVKSQWTAIFSIQKYYL